MKNLATDPKHAVIIINPHSGAGDFEKRKEQITSAAQKFGWEGQLKEITPKKSAAAIAFEEIEAGAKHIVICGGDGTIMEVLPALLESHVVLGIVPTGTGNLFAQNVNLSLDIPSAVETALLGDVQKIDIGRANETLFAVMAGIGFDAEVMKQAKREMKSKFGFFAYIVSGLQQLDRKSGVYQVTIDNKKPQRFKAKSIVIANMGKINGGIEAVPQTHSQNGKLKIGIIQASSLRSWINLLANAITGDINKSPHYKLLQGKQIEIISLHGSIPYQCDGDNFPPTKRLFVEIYPQVLPILVNNSSF